MHVDAESPGFRKFIENAEKELNLEIETIACPADADVPVSYTHLDVYKRQPLFL